MTPFGEKIRQLRKEKGVTQKQMAKDLGVSAAYLSALEHGHRGIPSWQFLQRIIGYFNIIWEDAEELQKTAARSHARVVVDTENLPSISTLLANELAANIRSLDEKDCLFLLEEIEQRTK